ncbi:glucose-1-phosphate adenylyltransferase [Anaerovirgula multivorans]|uniref:Glucose-1-phosphate adenylyltransferase n=1 Tax=Anaerovirgula multivorans TaxID=312168 RepID=A0A239K6C2_9FIRM|nr:glucose-1-phosphate adenylyltransferase subunit GlgD [Anaerovirgula multivorans]SNT13298.1 glucose-1-phosphate adenylyltransferase [Anaerovirgula multivorans]
MRDVMGIINDTMIKQDLREITSHRSTAAVPFGGRYRIIDFALSNMVNCGMKNVGIFTQSNNRSLLDHLNSGKEWDLLSKRDGLFVLPPTFRYDEFGRSLGDVDHFHNHMDYLKRSRQNYVLISNSNMIYNMDYRRVKEYYHQVKADIVILYKEETKVKDLSNFISIKTDEAGLVRDMAVNKEKSMSNKIALETAFMKKSLFIDVIDDCISRGYSDFAKDGLIKNLNHYKIYGYAHRGYVGKVHSILSYFQHNMDLLNPQIWKELFFKSGFIYTKIKDEAPVKYMGNANIQNSLVANGCVIEGTVINSILGRGVNVHKNAVVKNSIIMQKCQIAEDVFIENAILDKDVRITKGRQLKGESNYPMVIEKRVVI